MVFEEFGEDVLDEGGRFFGGSEGRARRYEGKMCGVKSLSVRLISDGMYFPREVSALRWESINDYDMVLPEKSNIECQAFYVRIVALSDMNVAAKYEANPASTVIMMKVLVGGRRKTHHSFS